MANKKSISQWTGVILALAASPFIFVASFLFGPELGGNGLGGIVLGLLFLAVGFYLFAFLVYKIVYFVIK